MISSVSDSSNYYKDKTYKVNNGKACIDGSPNGEPVCGNPSVNYGVWAMRNYNNYVDDLDPAKADFPDLSNLKGLSKDEFNKTMDKFDAAMERLTSIPIDFELKYSELHNGQIDKMSLLGASYEELGERKEVSVEELDKELDSASELFNEGQKLTSKALDINDDGFIDTAEYAVSILYEDSLSNSDGHINGRITNEGQAGALPCYLEQYTDDAKILFKKLYYSYGLDSVKKDFLTELK